MASVNPDLLKVVPKPNGVNRNSNSIVALMKSAVSSVLEGKILNVKLDNETELRAGLTEVVKLLREFSNSQKNLEIGKASVEAQKIDGFRVNNIESLSLENVESLAIALEQLKPVIELLRSANSSNKESIGLLNRLNQQIGSLKDVAREIAANKIRFPDTQRVSGSVSVTDMPDTSKGIVDAVDRLAGAFKTFMSKKEPAKESKIELAEGKMLAEKLDEIAESLRRLPGNMEFPQAVAITNFPPQKYPMPVTNININPLRGSVMTRAVTVTTSLTPLPGEVLAYRRSLVVYNNSSSVTIYVGGSNMTAVDGMPVPPNSYSPALDAGPKMILYARTSASTADVRVMELSNENIGG